MRISAMNEKPKNDSLRLNRLSFFLLWIVLWLGLAPISQNIFFMAFVSWIRQLMGEDFIMQNMWQIAYLEGFLYVALTAPVEKILLHLSFGKWVKGWITGRLLSAALSIILSIFPYYLINPSDLAMNTYLILPIIASIGLMTGLPMVLVLRSYVKNAWLYLLGSLISILLATYIGPVFFGVGPGLPLTIGASATVMALTMLWLFSRPISEEKAKRSEAVSHERLEDAEPETEKSQEERLETAANMRNYENQLD
jgi:hypothetical protein